MKKFVKRLFWPLFILILLLSFGSKDSGDDNPSSGIVDPTPIIDTNTLPTDPNTDDPNSSTSDVQPPSPAEPSTIPENSTFRVQFIDVGQADATLIECDGQYLLLDGGNISDSSLIYSVLRAAGADHLSLVIATHPHEDHVGGLAAAYRYADVGLTLCPVTSYDTDAFTNFAKYANQQGGITVPVVGTRYSLGSATVTILGVNSAYGENNASIVLKVEYGTTAFLFTGDAEREAELAILDSGADLSAAVLHVGHHGSDTSTAYPFLRAVAPQYAVISVGEGNEYAHPTDAVLSRLRDADTSVYRTDLHGDIYCESDGVTVTFTTEKSTDADVFAPGVFPTLEPDPIPEPTPDPEPEPDPTPAGRDYILNTNSMKFHYPSCGSVKKMADHNKSYYTGTREVLISQGYSPCGNCDP